MSDNPAGTSQPAGDIRVAPIAESVNLLSPEAAQARLVELRSDRAFGERLMKGPAGSTERAFFDALVNRVAGQPPEPPKAEPTDAEKARAGLEPPADGPDGYRVEDTLGRAIPMDADSEKVVRGTLLPAAHSLRLSQADVNMIAPMVLKPATEEACEASLRRLWKSDYDARLDDFRAAMVDPRLRALLEEYPGQLGNNAMLIASIVAAYRRRQGR